MSSRSFLKIHGTHHGPHQFLPNLPLFSSFFLSPIWLWLVALALYETTCFTFRVSVSTFSFSNCWLLIFRDNLLIFTQPCDISHPRLSDRMALLCFGLLGHTPNRSSWHQEQPHRNYMKKDLDNVNHGSNVCFVAI